MTCYTSDVYIFQTNWEKSKGKPSVYLAQHTKTHIPNLQPSDESFTKTTKSKYSESSLCNKLQKIASNIVVPYRFNGLSILALLVAKETLVINEVTYY